MNLIDAILSVASMLLWLNATVRQWSLRGPTTAYSLLRTLERLEVPSPRRWTSLAALVALLCFRSVFYWQIGSAFGWTPAVDLGPFAISFRSDHASRMFLYSWLSFATWLILLYLGILLLFLLSRGPAEGDSMHRFLSHQLGFLAQWPAWLLIPLTFAAALLVWSAAVLPLAQMAIFPAPRSMPMVAAHGLLMGAGLWLKLRWLVYLVLLLHILNSYVYFGNHPFWPFISVCGRKISTLASWLPLQLGKIDLKPLAAAGLVFLCCKAGDQALLWLFGKAQA